MNYKKIMQNLNILGEEYRKNLKEEFCKYQKIKDKLDNNWWNGLAFFFGRSFNRGRRDELSQKYKCFTIEVLKRRFEIEKGDLNKSYQKLLADKKSGYFDKKIISDFKEKHGISKKSNSIKHKKFGIEIAEKNPVIKTLTQKKKIKVDYRYFQKGLKDENVHLGNEKDVIMVLDVLNFISHHGKRNIYKHLRNSIKNKGVSKTYNLLIDNDTGISFIGDKLASFIIRDIIFIDPKIIKNRNIEYAYVFPIDVWVRRIYQKMEKSEKNISDENIKQFYIQKCRDYGYSPAKVAAGLWYLGFKSLDILLENLDELDV